MKIIIAGSGKVAFQCALTVIKKEYKTEVVEYKIAGISVLEKMCAKRNIPYRCLRKKEMWEYFHSLDEEAYIFSVMNTFLFPPDIIEKRNLTIINAHNAILPRHPGRNAECWQIYDGDEESGITWHYVTNDIDGGDIIMQEVFRIPPNSTAISLLNKHINLQTEMFEKVLGDVVGGLVRARKQVGYGEYPTHFSGDIPNRGEFDLKWSANKMYAFLRSMDYGPLRLLGIPYVYYNDRKCMWGGIT